jgi:uncharacterized protein
MTSQAAVAEFLAQPELAIVGVSRSGKKFGNMALRELRAKGYRMFPVHPSAKEIEGERCYRSLAEVPPSVGGVLIVVPPAQTDTVVREAAAAGIRRVWMQQGAESAEAIRFCEAEGVQVVAGECVLMFAEPSAWYHRAHKWVWRVLGKLPKDSEK